MILWRFPTLETKQTLQVVARFSYVVGSVFSLEQNVSETKVLTENLFTPTTTPSISSCCKRKDYFSLPVI